MDVSTLNKQIKENRVLLLKYCFYILNTKITNEKIDNKLWICLPKHIFVDGLFVTLTNVNNNELRSCLGTLNKINLIIGLKDFILGQDPRFKPIVDAEISNLKFSISILYGFEDANSPEDWEIGKHGIEIYYTEPEQENKVDYSDEINPVLIYPTIETKIKRGVFLPEVAVENKYTKIVTIKHLFIKIGIVSTTEEFDKLNINDNLLKNTTFVKFKIIKIEGSYKEIVSNVDINIEQLNTCCLKQEFKLYFSLVEYLLYKLLKNKIIEQIDKILISEETLLVFVLNVTKTFEKVKQALIAEFNNYKNQVISFVRSEDGYLFIRYQHDANKLNYNEEICYITNKSCFNKSSFDLLKQTPSNKNFKQKNMNLTRLYFFLKNRHNKIFSIQNYAVINNKFVDSLKQILEHKGKLDFILYINPEKMDVFIDREEDGLNYFKSFLKTKKNEYIFNYNSGFYREKNRLFEWNPNPIGIVNGLFTLINPTNQCMQVMVKMLHFNVVYIERNKDDENIKLCLKLNKNFELKFNILKSNWNNIDFEKITDLFIPILKTNNSIVLDFDGIFKNQIILKQPKQFLLPPYKEEWFVFNKGPINIKIIYRLKNIVHEIENFCPDVNNLDFYLI